MSRWRVWTSDGQEAMGLAAHKLPIPTKFVSAQEDFNDAASVLRRSASQAWTKLLAQQKDLTEMIFRLRFQLSTGQAEALKRLREAKKDLARVKTLVARA